MQHTTTSDVRPPEASTRSLRRSWEVHNKPNGPNKFNPRSAPGGEGGGGSFVITSRGPSYTKQTWEARRRSRPSSGGAFRRAVPNARRRGGGGGGGRGGGGVEIEPGQPPANSRPAPRPTPRPTPPDFLMWRAGALRKKRSIFRSRRTARRRCRGRPGGQNRRSMASARLAGEGDAHFWS